MASLMMTSGDFRRSFQRCRICCL